MTAAVFSDDNTKFPMTMLAHRDNGTTKLLHQRALTYRRSARSSACRLEEGRGKTIYDENSARHKLEPADAIHGNTGELNQ